MFKQIYITIISIGIAAGLGSPCLGMQKTLKAFSKHLKNKHYSYVLYRQTCTEIESSLPAQLTEDSLLLDKESDMPSMLLTLQDSSEKETSAQPKNIFFRLLEYLTPKTPTIEINNIEFPGKQIELSDTCFLKQLSVANQFSTRGGGHASCGYQSLKNALYLIRALQKPDELEHLSTTLNNLDIINSLFGAINKNSVGSWRAIIMQNRALNVFKNYLYQHLGLKPLVSIEETACLLFPTQEYFALNKNKIREVYATLLNSYAQDAAKSLTEGHTTKLSIQPDFIIEYLQNSLSLDVIKNIYDFVNQDPQEINEKHLVIECDDFEQISPILYDYLKDTKTIEKYVDIKAIKSRELSLENTDEVFDSYNKNNDNSSQQDGDWLQEEEIYTLKKLEEKNEVHCMGYDRPGLLCNLNYNLTIIEDVNDLTHSHNSVIDREIFQEIELKSQKGINKAKTALADSTQKDYIHAFIIGTATRFESIHGHWFVLLLYKHNSIHEYIIMDSANNSNRLYDDRVKTIISLLENQNLKDEIVATKEELTNLEKKINKMLNQNNIEVLEVIETYKECGGKKDFTLQLQQMFNK